MKRSCWFAELPGAGPCDGARVRCHLIPRQLLEREFPHGAVLTWEERPGGQTLRTFLRRASEEEGETLAIRPVSPLAGATPRELVADARSWVWGCGGPTGIGGHHGRLDSRGCDPLRIPRYRLPPGLEEFAEELGLGWWLDREYGPLV